MPNLKAVPIFEKTNWKEVRNRLPLSVPLFKEGEVLRAERLDIEAHNKLTAQQRMDSECRCVQLFAL